MYMYSQYMYMYQVGAPTCTYYVHVSIGTFYGTRYEYYEYE